MEPFAGREYLGATSLANARRIVSRCNLVQRWMSRSAQTRPGFQTPLRWPTFQPRRWTSSTRRRLPAIEVVGRPARGEAIGYTRRLVANV